MFLAGCLGYGGVKVRGRVGVGFRISVRARVSLTARGELGVNNCLLLQLKSARINALSMWDHRK